jgi:hypothetical protein
MGKILFIFRARLHSPVGDQSNERDWNCPAQTYAGDEKFYLIKSKTDPSKRMFSTDTAM